MFDGRYNKFICDKCNKTVFVKVYPKGWVYISAKVVDGGYCKHFCKECEDKRKEENGT